MTAFACVIYEKKLPSIPSQALLIRGTKLVAVGDNPFRRMTPSKYGGRLKILAGSGSDRKPFDLDAFRTKFFFDGRNHPSGGKNHASAPVLPGLCEGKTAHGVARAYFRRGISAQ